MKRPNQRFRHLQGKRASSDDAKGRQEITETDTKNTIADFSEHIVELPVYEDRTEHVEPNALKQWLLLWIPALLLLGAVVFVGVYAAITLERRNSASRERLRTLRLVQREVEQNLSLLQQQTAALADLEKATERLSSDVPPIEPAYAVRVWQAMASNPTLLENAPLYEQLTAFYRSIEAVGGAIPVYQQTGVRWQKAIKGLTLQKLQESRDARRLKAVVKAREEFVVVIRALQGSLQASVALGQQVLQSMNP